MIKKLSNNCIEINGRQICFKNETIRKLYDFNEISLLIFECGYPNENQYYNNVLAFENLSGAILWEIEADQLIDKQNPYMSALDNGSFLTLKKSNDMLIPINRKTGKIIRNIDLSKGHRPW